MRLRHLVLAIAFASSSACDSDDASPSARPADASTIVDGSSGVHDASMDALVGDRDGGGGAPDASHTPPDAGGSANCWAPPDSYCDGADQAEYWFCSSEGSRCCHLRNSCGPCGWTTCYLPCEDDAGCTPLPGCPGPLADLEARIGDWPECDPDNLVSNADD